MPIMSEKLLIFPAFRLVYTFDLQTNTRNNAK